jgi:hypothetical protein
VFVTSGYPYDPNGNAIIDGRTESKFKYNVLTYLGNLEMQITESDYRLYTNDSIENLHLDRVTEVYPVGYYAFEDGERSS